MVTLGKDEIVKYPFLAEAGNYLKDKGFDISQFGSDPDLKPLVKKAFNRIQGALSGKAYTTTIFKNNEFTENDLSNEVFSFLLSVILLKLSGKSTLIRRFSLAEARRAERFLEQDLKNFEDKKKEDLAKKILNELFQLRVIKSGEFFLLPISDYVKHSIHFHEKEWKLVNRRVKNGKVYLNPHETVRLVRRALDNFIFSRISNAQTPEMISGFEDEVEKLKSIAMKFSTPTITTTEYPPCIKHAMEVLNKGENLPHSGRFMLATYLIAKGQTVEQIAPLFKNAPDYDPKVTLYQLNHLAGKTGMGTQYSCPSCEKIESKDLCFRTSECGNILNPLSFGVRRKN